MAGHRKLLPAFSPPHLYLLFLIFSSLASISMFELFRPSLPPISGRANLGVLRFTASFRGPSVGLESWLGYFYLMGSKLILLRHELPGASAEWWKLILPRSKLRLSSSFHLEFEGDVRGIISSFNQDIEGQYLRNNGVDVEGKHSNNDGAESAERRMPRTILDPRGRFLQGCNKILLVSCVIAVTVDPLFFYIPIINDGKGQPSSANLFWGNTILILTPIMNVFFRNEKDKIFGCNKVAERSRSLPICAKSSSDLHILEGTCKEFK
uniref:Uncharacterized protein n=1 Tax=Fagus sylvatica TaxID=28930 RepID=A0A2N9F700_FAGSY